MNYRYLGKTGIEISELGMGTWPHGGTTSIGGIPLSYGKVTREMAYRSLETAYEHGINFYDTADIYGLGMSEYILGEVFHDSKDVFIATKCGYVPDGKYGTIKDFSFNHIIASAKRSLERLKRDSIDIFLLHVIPDNVYIWQEVKQAFHVLKKEGVIKHSGISIGLNYDKAKRFINEPEIDVIEIYYNLLLRNYENELKNIVEEKNIGVIAASPLNRGILSDTFNKHRKFEKSDVRNKFKKNKDYNLLMKKQDKLNEICRRYHISLVELALNYILCEKTVSTMIPGMKKEQYVIQNITAIKKECSAKLISEVIKELEMCLK